MRCACVNHEVVCSSGFDTAMWNGVSLGVGLVGLLWVVPGDLSVRL
jgi:hypothetical protein